MAESHVIGALRYKRSDIMNDIKELERRLKDRRAKLAHIDETIRLFDPSLDPRTFPVRRKNSRSGYFRHGELSRLVVGYLRQCQAPAPAPEITLAAMKAKNHDISSPSVVKAINLMVLMLLRAMKKRGSVVRIGNGRETKWAISVSEDQK